MAINTVWSCKKPNEMLGELLIQHPPSCEFNVSAPIDLSQLVLTGTALTSDSQWSIVNLNRGYFIYVPEYNDLLIASKGQMSSSDSDKIGNKVLVVHNFINKATNRPQINAADVSTTDIDIIPGLSSLTSGTLKHQYCFWQHNSFWQIYPDIEYDVPSGSAITGKLVRYTYDGIKLTKAQTINIGCGSTTTFIAKNNIQLRFSPHDNGMIWIAGTNSWITSTLIHINESVANDIYTADVITFDRTGLYDSLFSGQHLISFYFNQLGRRVYCITQGCNSSSPYDGQALSFNLSVDESSIANLTSSLNNTSNWYKAHSPYFQYNPGVVYNSANTQSLLSIVNKDNKTVLIHTGNGNGYLIADDVEQLKFNKQWDYVARNVINQSWFFALDNRFVAFKTPYSLAPLQSELDTGWLSTDTSGYTTVEQLKYLYCSWSEDGLNWYRKAVPFVQTPWRTSIDGSEITEGIIPNKRHLLLGRYLILFIDTKDNIYDKNNRKANLCVIDIGKRL